jgi:hypothetical protein
MIALDKIVLQAKAVQAWNFLSIRDVRNDSAVLGTITPAGRGTKDSGTPYSKQI